MASEGIGAIAEGPCPHGGAQFHFRKGLAMADKNSTRDRVSMEDVVEVGSRVSWGAILAGAVMAMAISFVFTLIGQAIGVTVSDRTSSNSLGFAAALWTIITATAALFVGGWITSQCIVGETKAESVVHGIIMWGVAFAMLMWGTASGVRSNFTAMMQVANMAGVIESGDRHSLSADGTAAIPQENADHVAQSTETGADRRQSDVEAPAGTRIGADADRAATRATWWTLATTLLSVAAAVAGALVGAGPTFRLLPIHVTHRHFSSRSAATGST
jgi:hypothetical protein